MLARLVILFLLSFGDVVSSQTYEPIATLNVPAYMGRWYQMYTSKLFILIELGGRCTTADYTLRSDGKVALINQSRPWLIPPIFARTTGFAVQIPSPGLEGTFTVTQQYLKEGDADDVEFEAPGNYWIIGIGPIVNNEYQWAVVSDPNKATVFILARDPQGFKGSAYEDEALAVLEDFGGFDKPTNKPIPTSHVACLGYK
jgi:apolipoprotein D and lipocalin family protein